MNEVTQNTAASAEENAAAAEELQSQAETMKQAVLDLVQMAGLDQPALHSRPHRAASSPVVEAPTLKPFSSKAASQNSVTLVSSRPLAHKVPVEEEFKDF